MGIVATNKRSAVFKSNSNLIVSRFLQKAACKGILRGRSISWRLLEDDDEFLQGKVSQFILFGPALTPKSYGGLLVAVACVSDVFGQVF